MLHSLEAVSFDTYPTKMRIRLDSVGLGYTRLESSGLVSVSARVALLGQMRRIIHEVPGLKIWSNAHFVYF
jgi:hypothetical protein